MDIDAIKKELDSIDNNTKSINDSTAQIRAILDGPPQNIIPVNPGDNLASIIASAPAGSILSINNAYNTSADLVIDKPLTLQAKNPIKPGRIDLKANVPLIQGTVTIAGPNVNLICLNMTGVNQNSQILTLGDNSNILQCILYGGVNGQHRAIWADAKNQLIQDSYIGNIWLDIDTQAIFCYNGCNGLNVVNTYLEASGENFMAGGADASSADNIPQNITFDNCDFIKPLAWKDKIAVKNLFELKCAKKVTLKNSRLQNCWQSGQTGYGIVINVRNQGGAAPFSVIEDVLIDNCDMTNVGAGFQFLGMDDLQPSGHLSRVTINNNRIQINTDLGASRQILINNGSDQLKHTNNKFTYIGANEPNSFFYFTNPANLSTGFEFDGNEFQEGDYGIFGDGAPALGYQVLDMYAPSYMCNGNTVKKGTSGRWIQYPSCITLV